MRKWINFYKYLWGSSSPEPETDVHLIIRRKNVTFYLKTCEFTKISILKKMIEPIFKVRPGDQQLFLMDINKPNFEHRELFDSKSNLNPYTLFDYNLTASTARAECPATVGLAIRKKDGSFENLEITPYKENIEQNFEEEPDLILECLTCATNVKKNPVIKWYEDVPDNRPGSSRQFLAIVWHGLVHIPKLLSLLLLLSIAIAAGAVWYTLVQVPNDHQKSPNE